MSRVLSLIVILLIGIYSLNADDQKERNFKVSGGYSLSFISDYDSKFGMVDYKTTFPSNYHVGISMILNRDKSILTEPGIRYITRNWGFNYWEDVGNLTSMPKFCEDEAKMSFLDLQCKFKYNRYSDNANLNKLRLYPYVGLSGSILLKSMTKYSTASMQGITEGECIEENWKPKNWYDRISLHLLLGMDIDIMNRYSLGVGYDVGVLNMQDHAYNDKMLLHTISFSMGVLF